MKPVYLDIETTGLNFFTDHVVTCQILHDGKVSIFKGSEISKLKPLLEDSLVIGHNLIFDLSFIKQQFGIIVKHVYDTRIAEIAISGGQLAKERGTKLQHLVKKYLSFDMDKTEQTGFRIGKELSEAQIQYAALDVLVLPAIYQAQQARIKELNLEDTLDIEMQCLPGVVWLGLSGILIDQAKLNQLREQTLAKQNNAELEIHKTIAEYNKAYQQTLEGSTALEVNLRSHVKLKEILNSIGVACTSTNETELKKFDHPIVSQLLDHKAATKLLDTIKKLPQHINSSDGRLHASFNQYGARSGRFTCKEPNLQQQENTPEWRSVFIPAPGNKIVTADYSQIELRILGEVSGDPMFIQAYHEGQDLHRLTASRIFNVPLDEVTKEQRQISKKVNFSVIYGRGWKGLKESLSADGIEVSEAEAIKFIDGFYKAYPAIEAYLNGCGEKGLKNLQIRNAAGRLFTFTSPKGNYEKGSLMRKCRNLPIQGLCADMVKIAIGRLHRILEPLGVNFINCVHDELVFECLEDEAQLVADIVKEEMEAAGERFMHQVPCIAEVSIADSWCK